VLDNGDVITGGAHVATYAEFVDLIARSDER
jgi:hypothetical protein